MLYHHLSTFAGDGMTHAECRVHDEGGAAARLLHRRRHGAPFGAGGPRPGRADGAVSLTTGRGPLSAHPAGRFTPRCPTDVAYIEPFRRRVRATKDGRTVVDSERRPAGAPSRVNRPTYAFPTATWTASPAGARRPTPPATSAVDWDGRRRLVRGGRAGVRTSAQPVPPGGLPALAARGSGSR